MMFLAQHRHSPFLYSLLHHRRDIQNAIFPNAFPVGFWVRPPSDRNLGEIWKAEEEKVVFSYDSHGAVVGSCDHHRWLPSALECFLTGS